MTPELKKFLLAANAARAAVAFHKCKTLEEVCNQKLGVNVPRKYDGSKTPDSKTLNRIIKTYERWYKRKGNWNLPTSRESKREVESTVISEEHTGLLPPPERNKKQTCTLYPFQQREALKIWNNMFGSPNHPGGMLRMNVGDGKTFVFGQIIRWAIDSGWIETHRGLSVHPIVVVTKASIVEQTSRDLESEFGLDVPGEVLVINYDSLRAKFGKLFIEEKTRVLSGEVTKEYIWRPLLNPVLFILDEYQALKNTDSTQSEIAQAINNIKLGMVKVLCSSATPFSRVTSAKVFAVSTHKKWHHIGLDLTLTNENWMAYANHIAFPSAPDEFNKAAVKRLVKDLKPYIYSPTHVVRKHKSINNTLLLDFQTPEERAQYEAAWEKYLTERAKLESLDGKGTAIMILVEFLKFRQAASLIKAPAMCRLMYDAVANGYAAILAENFKPTIAKMVNILYQDYNVPRSEISLIWGGDSRFTGRGDKLDKQEIIQMLEKAKSGGEVDLRTLKKILTQLQVESMGLGDLPPELDLGIQSREERQREIDKYQSGKALYCMFTFGAGGAGLSLHHRYEFLRPRRTFIAATYNEMEHEQAIGRAHRINSLSDTEQSTVLYRGTIEQRVLARRIQKGSCLNVIMEHTELSKYDDVDKILAFTAEGEDEDMSEAEFEELTKE